MAEKVNIILLTEPGHLRDAAKTGLPIAVMAYRIGQDYHLYRTDLPACRGDYMVIDDLGFLEMGSAPALSGEIIRECAVRGYRGIVLNAREGLAQALRPLAARLAEAARENALELYLPPWVSVGDSAQILICTALSGGTLARHFAEAGERHGRSRLAADIERVRMDFALPSADGTGQPLTPAELGALFEKMKPSPFFSQELCAYYFTYRKESETHFVLYDNAVSIRKKLALAREHGIKNAFIYYPEVKDILRDILQ